LTAAQRTGYAQSKLVAEHICVAAAKATGLAAKVLRIGQVVGDTKFGIWNASEAVPMILKSASTIGSLPMLDEWHSWLPVDVVATVILGIAFVKPGESGVFNVVNSKSFHWTWDLLLLLREVGVHFQVKGRREWLRRLRSVPDPVSNPPYRLIDFFEVKYGKETLAPTPVFATGRAQAASPAMKDLQALDRHMAHMAVQRIMGS
jgi:thioester reductase-like protein